MSTWYEYQDAKSVIVRALRSMGWTIYGYTPDRSEPMNDYFSPEYWRGVATKNDYVLCVDVSESEQARHKDGELVTPGHMPNPPRCNWHIEKNGRLYDKGAGILRFAHLAYVRGPASSMSQAQLDDYTAFQKWLGRIESIASKTEEQLKDQEVKVVDKTVDKMINTVQVSKGSQKVDQCFVLCVNFNYGCYKGYVYRIKEVTNGYLTAVKLNGKLDKECTGRANRANWFKCSRSAFSSFIASGSIKYCDIVPTKTAVTYKTTTNA